MNKQDIWLISIICLIVISTIILISIVAYVSQLEYETLESKIPNMNCKELIMAYNKYDYFLNDEDDLFNKWYERILELRCINP